MSAEVEPDLRTRKFNEYSASTVPEWTSILALADRWSFASIRDLSIAQLALLASPADKVSLGRRYAITSWLTDAYLALCLRADPLSTEEARRLGVDEVMKIWTCWRALRSSTLRENISEADRRRIVERTFGWLGRSRRLSKEYERTIESSEAFVKVAMIHLMVRRLRR